MQLLRMCFLDILRSKVRPPSLSIPILCVDWFYMKSWSDFLDLSLISGEFLQEGQLDFSFLPLEEADPAILLIYSILHHSPFVDVPARGSFASLGCLLCPWFNVCYQYTSCAEVIPVYSPIPTF